MTLINFEQEDLVDVTKVVVPPRNVTEEIIEVHESFHLDPIPSATHKLTSVGGWEWRELRDYVVAEIEKRFGPQPRDAKKEASIFKSFLSRHDDAVEIAKYAFEITDGWWAGAPIGVNRFCIASDAYFAERIRVLL